MTSEATVVPERLHRSAIVEMDYTTQMLTAWPDLLDQTREVAQAHEVPEGHEVLEVSHRVIRVATPGQPGLVVWHFLTFEPLEIDPDA